MFIANFNDNDYSLIGKFFRTGLTSLNQPQLVLVNSKLDSNHQKLVDLFYNRCHENMKIKGVAFLKSVSISYFKILDILGQ